MAVSSVAARVSAMATGASLTLVKLIVAGVGVVGAPVITTPLSVPVNRVLNEGGVSPPLCMNIMLFALTCSAVKLKIGASVTSEASANFPLMTALTVKVKINESTFVSASTLAIFAAPMVTVPPSEIVRVFTTSRGGSATGLTVKDTRPMSVKGVTALLLPLVPLSCTV